jgi:hypothetical protein
MNGQLYSQSLYALIHFPSQSMILHSILLKGNQEKGGKKKVGGELLL